MNIVRNDIDELNAILQLEVTTEDYLPDVNASLKKIRKQVQMKGFRPGMVPIGLVKRKFGESVMVEEIEKIVGKSLQDYIQENELKILFAPLLVPQKNLQFSAQEPSNFTFDYEIGLAPPFDLNYTNDTITKYAIEMSDDFIEEELNLLRRRFGIENEVEPPIEHKDILSIRLEELQDDGLLKEEGASNDTLIAVDLIKDADIQAALMKLGLNEQLDINLKKAFDKKEEDLLNFLLDKKDEEADGLGMDYRLTVIGIKRVELADMTPDFFEQVYRDKEIDTEEKFMERFRKDFEELSDARSEERFKIDIYNYLLETVQMGLPEEFIKKYIQHNTEAAEDMTDEKFGDYLKSVKWELIRNKIANENEIKVESIDVEEYVIEDTKKMYYQYMQLQISNEDAKVFSQNMMKDQKYVNEVYGKVLEHKLFDVLTTQVKSESQSISFKDFRELN